MLASVVILISVFVCTNKGLYHSDPDSNIDANELIIPNSSDDYLQMKASSYEKKHILRPKLFKIKKKSLKTKKKIKRKGYSRKSKKRSKKCNQKHPSSCNTGQSGLALNNQQQQQLLINIRPQSAYNPSMLAPGQVVYPGNLGSAAAPGTCDTSTNTKTSLPDDTNDSFQNDCLAATNADRAAHSANPLVIDANAVAFARQRCQLMSQYNALEFGHSDLEGYGENIFFAYRNQTGSFTQSCQDAIAAWYAEGDTYDVNNPGVADHFSQLVWKGSTGVGCARCEGLNPCTQSQEAYIVCVYTPPGNVQGEFAANVS